MAENLTEIFVALLAQEKYRADRELNHTLDELWGGLMGRGVYHSSDNVFKTKQCFESDLENRRETALTSATRVLSGASRRQASDLKPAITQLAIDWLGANIDKCQSRLTQHAVKLNLNSPELVDLGRDRLVATLSAELALISESSAMPLSLAEAFVDAERLDGLAALAPSQLDVSRLIRLCEEVNICFRCQCFHAVAFLTRPSLITFHRCLATKRSLRWPTTIGTAASPLRRPLRISMALRAKLVTVLSISLFAEERAFQRLYRWMCGSNWTLSWLKPSELIVVRKWLCRPTQLLNRAATPPVSSRSVLRQRS